MKSIRGIVATAALAIAAVAVTAQSAQAGTVFNVKIVEVAITGSRYATVKFDQNIQNRASCATVVNTMVIDIGTTKGRAALTVANAALLGNLNVLAFGTQLGNTATCSSVTLTSGGPATSYETVYTLGIAP